MTTKMTIKKRRGIALLLAVTTALGGAAVATGCPRSFTRLARVCVAMMIAMGLVTATASAGSPTAYVGTMSSDQNDSGHGTSWSARVEYLPRFGGGTNAYDAKPDLPFAGRWWWQPPPGCTETPTSAAATLFTTADGWLLFNYERGMWRYNLTFAAEAHPPEAAIVNTVGTCTDGWGNVWTWRGQAFTGIGELGGSADSLYGEGTVSGSRDSYPTRIVGKTLFVDRGEFRWDLAARGGRKEPPDSEDELRADPGGPYTVERTGQVTLDGSNSTGRIKSYRWTFERANGGCPAKNSHRNGRRTTIVALCALRATLTVSDGRRRSKPARTTVTVTPRKLHPISFARRAPRRLKKSNGGLAVDDHNACLGCKWGRVVCTRDGLRGDQRSGHTIHGGLIGHPGFAVASVHDPGGPFDGRWYVKDHTLAIDRTPLVNERLYPGDDVYNYNTNARHPGDVDRVRRSVEAHEGLHIDVLKEDLERLTASRRDPVRRLEAAVGKTRSELMGHVSGKIIYEANEKLDDERRREARVHARMRLAGWDVPANLWLKDAEGDWHTFKIRSLASLGDE